MKKPYLFLWILFAVAALLAYNLHRAQARLQDASKRLDVAETEAKQAAKRRQVAQARWDAYNREELRAIVAQMRPTLHLANKAGNTIKIYEPLPPIELAMRGKMDYRLTENLQGEFQYKVTKGRVSIYRIGKIIAQETREDDKILIAGMGVEPFDWVVCEALEMVRIDKAGGKTPVKPKNPVITFIAR